MRKVVIQPMWGNGPPTVLPRGPWPGGMGPRVYRACKG